MGEQFSPVGGGPAFFHLADEPFIVVDKALNRFSRQKLGIASARGSNACEPLLYIGIEVDFHSPNVEFSVSRVNTPDPRRQGRI
jgi:hypothetical protein